LYTEKLTYSEGGCRTLKMNEQGEIIYVKNKELLGKKKGQKLNKKSLSHNGWASLLLSTDFMYDLTRLANLKGKMMEIDPQLSERLLQS